MINYYVIITNVACLLLNKCKSCKCKSIKLCFYAETKLNNKLNFEFSTQILQKINRIGVVKQLQEFYLQFKTIQK